MSTTPNPIFKSVYEPMVADARRQLSEDATLVALQDPNIDPRVLHAFLIQYSALGVRMTKPVESWIRRAGERCQALGYAQLGRALVMHARHEADHDNMMVDDTKVLVQRWNGSGLSTLEADALFAQPEGPSTVEYVRVHEDTIAGNAPFAQIAIEYEVERLSTVWIPEFLNQCKRVLGDDIVKGMTFLEEHALLDVGHTQMNENELNKFLNEHPASVEVLARTGAAGLTAYISFLGECYVNAKAMVAALDAQNN